MGTTSERRSSLRRGLTASVTVFFVRRLLDVTTDLISASVMTGSASVMTDSASVMIGMDSAFLSERSASKGSTRTQHDACYEWHKICSRCDFEPLERENPSTEALSQT